MQWVATIESRRGRQHREHKTSDMTAPSQPHPETSTFPQRFGVVGLSATVRHLTETMLAGWDELPMGRRVPADRSVAALKADVKLDKKQPIQHVMRLAVAALDAGIPVVRATQWFRDAIAYLEGYAARKERRQSLGILPFPERWARVWTRETREQAEADCSAIAVGDGRDLTALRCARV